MTCRLLPSFRATTCRSLAPKFSHCFNQQRPRVHKRHLNSLSSAGDHDRSATAAIPVTSEPLRTEGHRQPRVSVAVCVFSGDHVLLVQRGKAPGKGKWAFPGGSVELGETTREAAVREVFEETGLQVMPYKDCIYYASDVITRDPDSGEVKFHYVLTHIAATTAKGCPTLVAADDAADARWFSAKEAMALHNKSLGVTDSLKRALWFRENGLFSAIPEKPTKKKSDG